MPFTFRTKAQNVNTNSITVAGVVGGDLVVIYTKWEGVTGALFPTIQTGSAEPLTADDNTLRTQAAGGDLHGMFHYALNTSSAGSVTYTVTWPSGTASSWKAIMVLVYSYTGGSTSRGAYVLSGADTHVSGIQTAGALTTQGSDSLVVSAFADYGGGQSYGIAQNLQIGGVAAEDIVGGQTASFTNIYGIMGARRTTLTAQNATVSQTYTGAWVAGMIEFKIGEGSSNQAVIAWTHADSIEF
jgi:hypothetical protein